MKSIRKVAESLGLFSPVFILLFACASYMVPPKEPKYPEKEADQAEIKSEKVDVMREILMQKF